MKRFERINKSRLRRIVKQKNPKVLKNIAIAFAIVTLAAVIYLQYLAPRTLEAKQRAQLESTKSQLTNTKQLLQNQKVQDAETQKKLLELQKKLEETEKALQAKREANTAYAAAPAPRAYTGGGNKEVWMAAAGIPQDVWWAVDSIVSRESGWNPCAYNPGMSDCNANPTSACGLAQSLPCGKQSKFGHWTDPVANLKWQYEYVTQRYGGYPQAVAFWNVHHWY